MENKWTRIASSPEAAALLKLFLRIDAICDHSGNVSEFLPHLLHQLAQLLDVQAVAVTAYGLDENQVVLSRYDRGTRVVDDEQLIELADRTIGKDDWLTTASGLLQIDNILAFPIAKHATKLGALILINKSSGEFGEYDRIVVTMVETRLDDVIDEMLKSREQKRINTENRVMKELDKIHEESTDQGMALDEMIRVILESVGAQIGFITLHDPDKDRHLPGGKVIRGPRPMSQQDYHQVGNLIRKSRDSHQTLMEGRIAGSEIDSIIVVPMFIASKFLGAVVLINKDEDGSFSEQDRELVETVTRMIDSFIFQEEKFKRLMVLVGQEATRDVEEALIGHRPDTALGQRLDITMLFADIRDYSSKIKDMDF